jgi:hypothetical protein
VFVRLVTKTEFSTKVSFHTGGLLGTRRSVAFRFVVQLRHSEMMRRWDHGINHSVIDRRVEDEEVIRNVNVCSVFLETLSSHIMDSGGLCN